MLHTLLNGDAVGQHLQCDLSSYHLSLSRLDRGRLYPLASTELNAPATSPPITRLRIICDLLPQWPMEMSVSGMSLTPSRRERPAIGCITVADVLSTVHTCLQTAITHDEWGRLSDAQETDIARAYTRRYKAFAAVESQVKREGVKRVDYLLKKIYFQGLTWLQPEAGVERVKLLVGIHST
ncbi:hypothetical protein OF83DRAFT_1069835 [Amylostereum chailletii]|nr:hypothetical protein OF83DRAFT_1069835 [Amylostereum chailletii]